MAHSPQQAESLSNREKKAQRDRALAEKFKPILLLYPEFERKHRSAAKAGQADPELTHDYHPRDIRLVLSMANRRPHIEATGWRRIIQTIGRQWPEFVSIVSISFAIGWIVLFIKALLDGGIQPLWWGVYGAFTLIPLILAFYAVIQAPWLWKVIALMPAMTASVLGIVLLYRRLPDQDVWITGGVVVIVTPFLAYLLVYWLARRAKFTTDDLLTWITGLANPEAYKSDLAKHLSEQRPFRWLHPDLRSRLANFVLWARDIDTLPERVHLRYEGVGSPSDRFGHRRAYVNALAKGGREQYPATFYARVVSGGDVYGHIVAVQYWMAYFYNNWDNTHEMDWEQATVYVRYSAGNDVERTAVPQAVAFSAHFGGTIVDWKRVAHPDDRPVSFVARGSHANYPRQGRRWPALEVGNLTFTTRDLGLLGRDLSTQVDKTMLWDTGHQMTDAKIIVLPDGPADDGLWGHACPDGEHTNVVAGICENDFRWLNLEGTWGAPGGLFGGESPVSPPKNPAWQPFIWIDNCKPFEATIGERFVIDIEALERLEKATAQPAAQQGSAAGNGGQPAPVD